VVMGIAFPLLFVAPVAGAGLLAACAATRRLAPHTVVVPDRLPRHWAG
jgi:hypothetical protein